MSTTFDDDTIRALSDALVESERLQQLTNKQLVIECLNFLGVEDNPIAEEMMSRLYPGWEHLSTSELLGH